MDVVGESVLGVDVDSLDADSALELIAELERLSGVVQALQAEALVRFSEAYAEAHSGEFAAAELGAALGWSRRSAENRMHRAAALVRRLPGALAAMRRGALDYAKGSVLVDSTAPLSGDAAAAVAGLVLPESDGATLRQFGMRVRKAVVAADPDGAAEHARRVREGRRVCFTPMDDGVTELFAILKSEDAAAVSACVERVARDLTGTAEQRRVDALVALILGAERPNVTVRITIPAGGEPAEIEGENLVPAQVARRIATDSAWRRTVCSDPKSGSVLDNGRARYSPSRALREHVVARDRTCRFPGCEYPASRCDLDHTTPFESGGATAHHNLGAFCRHHHRVKHEAGWTVTQPSPGEFRFTSPLGRTYRRSP